MPQNEYKPSVSSEFTKVWTEHYLLNFILVKNDLAYFQKMKAVIVLFALFAVALAKPSPQLPPGKSTSSVNCPPCGNQLFVGHLSIYQLYIGQKSVGKMVSNEKTRGPVS